MGSQKRNLDKKGIIDLYVGQQFSLRAICRELKISESNKNKISDILKDNSIKIRRGKIGTKIGDRVIEICPTCGKKKQVILRKLNRKPILCRSCAVSKSHKNNPKVGRAESHYNWKGGINLNRQGYIVEYVKNTSKWFAMASNTHRTGGYVLQHRLVMAKHLKRLLTVSEIVHHINGDKQNNRISNLQLTDRKNHKVTYQDGFREGYKRACEDLKNKTWNGEDWVKI